MFGLPEWSWYAIGGATGGLLLAHLVDVLAASWKRYWRGDPAIATHFSPKGGCTEAVVAHVSGARFEVLVQAYSFTSKEIANALIAAVGRGVKVMVLLDKSNERETHTELGDLTAHGLEVLVDSCHAIAHNKVIVVDGRTVLTGSFNFTNQAEHENAENLLILQNHHDLAEKYRTNFHHHREHCQHPGEAHIHHVRLRKAA